MNYRLASVLAEKSLSSAGTETIDIKLTQAISRLLIRFAITASSTHTFVAHPAVDITKIELVDGSDVLHSTNGYCNQAVVLYDRRIPELHGGIREHSCDCWNTYAIDFGRKLWDPVLAFDPTRFRNPQLKITYTLTGFSAAATAAKMEVMAQIFDEKQVSPIGFLQTKEIWSKTMPASGSFEYVELPRDLAYRKVFIQGKQAAYRPWYQISDFKLSEDNDRRVPFDVDVAHYIELMKGSWQPVVEEIYQWFDVGADQYFVTPTDYFTLAGLLTTDTTTVEGYRDAINQGGEFTWTQSGNDREGHFLARGYCPHWVVEFPLAEPDTIEDFYDPTKLGSLEARLKAGSGGASGTGKVIVQQLRRY